MKRQAMMQAQKEKQQAAGPAKESLLIISHWESCINFWSKSNDTFFENYFTNYFKFSKHRPKNCWLATLPISKMILLECFHKQN